MIFNHSGNFGDICYSLPFCMTMLRIRHAKRAVFHLQINVKADYHGIHPLGNVRMDAKVASILKPLLLAQPWISNVTISPEAPKGNDVIDLDLFRTMNTFDFSRGSISHWYYPTVPDLLTPPSLEVPWLKLPEPRIDLKNKSIILFRSERYRLAGMSYHSLAQHAGKILFLGLEREHADFCNNFFPVDFFQIVDFLQAAKLILAAKLVIGNQTGLFALAEALKKPRLLETSRQCPNVIMSGGSFQYIVNPVQSPLVFKNFIDAFIG